MKDILQKQIDILERDLDQITKDYLSVLEYHRESVLHGRIIDKEFEIIQTYYYEICKYQQSIKMLKEMKESSYK